MIAVSSTNFAEFFFAKPVFLEKFKLSARHLEPIQKVVESEESVVIRYMVPVIERGTRCGPQSTAD